MKTLFKIITNKYVLAFVIFGLMILFFSPYDLFTIRDSQNELDDINAKIEFLSNQSDSMDTELQKLKTDPATLEKYARESYHQKREGEDVYIIIPHTDSVKKN